MWILWLIIMAVLMIVEVIFMTVWLLCLALGCVAGVICSIAGASLTVQIGVSAVSSVVAYIVLIPYFQKYFAKLTEKRGRYARTGMDALVGRKGKLLVEITPDSYGRLRIDGDNWQVRTNRQDKVVEKGTEVVVTGYDSIILTVEPVFREFNL